jgi:hypothetical protein
MGGVRGGESDDLSEAARDQALQGRMVSRRFDQLIERLRAAIEPRIERRRVRIEAGREAAR